VVLEAVQDFHDLNWDKLRLGFVPLIDSLNPRESDAQLTPGPLVLKKESDEPSTFGIQIDGSPEENCSELCDRAEAALRYLGKKHCQIVLFPEMVMPDPIVSRLQKVLGELALRDEPRPGLVLCGTFTRMVERYVKSQPFNVAIALNHCGQELWRQRKMQPYDMKRHEQRNFGLEPLLNSESCRESIAFTPRKLRLVDSQATGLRMMVLICEDVTRDPGLRVAHQLQPTLILAPVMAGPLVAEGGFSQKISAAQERAASIFAVANSAALARAAWKERPGNPPLALVGLPLLNVAKKFLALDVLEQTETVPGTAAMQVLYYEFPA
jgi:predicted amidohydrolase